MPRVLFFGMSGAYSALALRAIVGIAGAHGIDLTIAAVVLPQLERYLDRQAAPSAPLPPFRWIEWTQHARPSHPARPVGIALPSLGMTGSGGALSPRPAEQRPSPTGSASLGATTRLVARELGLPLLEVANIRDDRVR